MSKPGRVLRRGAERADHPCRQQVLNDPALIERLTECRQHSSEPSNKSSDHRWPDVPEEGSLATQIRQVWYQGGANVDVHVVKILPRQRHDSPEGQ